MLFNKVFKIFVIGMLFLSALTVTTVAIMTVSSQGSKTPIFGDRFDKLSIDDTPLVIITDKQTGCRYIYDTVNKTTRVSDHSPTDNCSTINP